MEQWRRGREQKHHTGGEEVEPEGGKDGKREEREIKRGEEEGGGDGEGDSKKNEGRSETQIGRGRNK